MTASVDATVEKMARSYEGLTDAQLAKKIRHLVRAEGRCSLPRNAALMRAFLRAALDIADRRARANLIGENADV